MFLAKLEARHITVRAAAAASAHPPSSVSVRFCGGGEQASYETLARRFVPVMRGFIKRSIGAREERRLIRRAEEKLVPFSGTSFQRLSLSLSLRPTPVAFDRSALNCISSP
jgi:hypothetical protein